MADFERQMLERARDMRNTPTPFETILWSRLSRSQLGGYKFRRQAVIGRHICDFFCPQKALIVEADGDTHNPVTDAERDAALAKAGFTTLRFGNSDIGHNLDGVLEVILATLKALPERWNGPPGLPHPNPAGPQPSSPKRAKSGPAPEGEGLEL